MISIPGNVRVWLATGHTDMRRGFPSLARLVQESFRRDPHAGDLYVFRGRRGDLIKIIWHDGQGACLFTKRLERGRFLWPSLADGVVTISVAQLSYLLSGLICGCRRQPGVHRLPVKSSGIFCDEYG
ncbi:IS66 family insertion sequence element accessory protein TnpB [Bradyrhizobium genosp. A]|uniref:IS66 family insertion sequence element accessory protein TnpB n=1 Tax=Bradyrhizobium genosp. A TaxID=83626 RepID=UPI003CEED292